VLRSLREWRECGFTAAPEATSLQVGGGNSLSTSVLHAKAFFDTNWSPQAKTRTPPSEPLQALVASLDVVPDWDYAVLSENEVESYLEVPVDSDTHLGFGPVGVTDESQIHLTDRRVVVRQIKETGQLYLYTSLWIPDDEESLIAMPSLNMFDKGLFSGRIYFFLPSGEFYWGAGFSEGLPVSSVTLVDDQDDSGPTTRAAGVTSHCDLVTEGFTMLGCNRGPNNEPIDCWETGHSWISNQYIECWGYGGGNIPIPTDPDGPEPGSGGGGGGGSGNQGSSDDDDDNPESVVPDPVYEATVDSLEERLMNSVANLIANVSNQFAILFVSSLSDGNIAGFTLSFSDMFDSSKPLTLQFPVGLTDTQMKLILAHEILGHLTLFDVMREAGNLSNLSQENPDLYIAIGQNQWNPNDGHHWYWGNNIEEYEQMLRGAFPGESEDFYEYGKWGGEFYNSPGFDALPPDEQIAILEYLDDNDLYNNE
jgi:hypothetical protein